MKYVYFLAMLLPGLCLGQPIFVSGRIISAEGQVPVEGATITLLNSNRVYTTKDGDFSFAVTSYTDTLLITSIGYEAKKVVVPARAKFPLVIQLTPKLNNMDEVLVVGYGTTTRRLNTGNVSKITAAEISKQPVTNPLQALQGRAAGVFIASQNGLPGGNLTVQIRGTNSITSGNNPLYIVDGVPFISTPMNTGLADFTNANDVISPLNSINPADIESIEILKDADATAIYGSRAANGVVLITTKRGKSGRTKADVNIYTGISKLSRYAQYLTLPEYLQMRREAFANDGVVATESTAPDLLVWDTTKYADWQKFILGGTASVTDIQASVSGGNEQTNFLIGGGYRKEGSILPGDQRYRKAGVHFNLQHSSASKRFSVSLQGSYTADNNRLPGPVTSFLTLPPDFPLYEPSGYLNWRLNFNPAAALLQKTESKTESEVVNGILRYTILPGITIKGTLGYSRMRLNQLTKTPTLSLHPLFGEPNSASFGNSENTTYIAEPQADFFKVIGKGELAAVAGGTWQHTTATSTLIKAINYNNEALFESIRASNGFEYVTNRFSEYKYVSVFGRVNYSLLKKYIINASFRRDGSSRFGSDKAFGNFGAAGVAWLFSREETFIKHVPFISSGKLRASYGIVGNDQISDYQYLQGYSPGPIYLTTTSLLPNRIGNPDYGWESTTKAEVAMELGFLKDRLLLTTAWYRNRSSNQLVNYPLPSQAGFTSYLANLSAMVENTGWEFDLNTVNIRSSDFSWGSHFNLTIPKTKLLRFPGIEATSYASQYVVGEDLNIVKGYSYTGVDAQTGIAQYEDIDKDGSISTNDRVIIGTTSPRLYGGLNNSFSYKGFQFNIFMQFSDQDARTAAMAPGSAVRNQLAFIQDRWRQQGDITHVPRASATRSSEAFKANDLLSKSSATFTNDFYIRCKNISLSYRLPDAVKRVMKVTDSRIYIEGQNIFTVSSKDRTDPEVTSPEGIAPLRSFVLGIQLSF